MFSDLRSRFRSLFRRHRVESELDTEIRFHMENEVQKHVESGMPPGEAARRVRVEFGGFDQIKEECRQARGVELLDNFVRDTRYGMRKLANDWRFSLAALLILTLGIGANTAMFSFVNTIVLRPRPFASPDRLVDIYQDSDSGTPTASSFPAYRDMAAMDGVFSGVAAWYPATVGIESGDSERTGLVDFATSSLFPVLGVQPSLGRWFGESDDVGGSEAVAVLTYPAWVQRWGSDPGVLGTTVLINGAPVRIVGVGPSRLAGGYPGIVFDFWLSLSSLASVESPYAAGTLDRRSDHWFQVKARLGAGVGIAEARAAMGALADRLAREYPVLNDGRGITVFEAGEVRLHPAADGVLVPTASLLLVAMTLILGIAVSNLAILLLVRGAFRSREVAMRLVLGATRGRIVSQLLVESVVLSLAGGALGLLVANQALRLLTRFESSAPVPLTIDLSLDHRVLIFTFVLSTLTGVVFGLVPALRSSRSDLTATLRDGASALVTGRRWFTLRNVLVMSQVAASFLLLAAAGLLARSLVNAANTDVGFQVDDVAFVSIDPGRAGYEGDELTDLSNRVIQGIRGIPGVRSVARVNLPPFRGMGTTTTTMLIDGYQPRAGTAGVEITRMNIDPDYLETLGIPLLYGRNFTTRDTLESEQVALINETMARRYFGSPDAVGGRFRPQTSEPDEWIRVVGIVGDTKVADPTEDARPVYYRPVRQLPFGPVTIMARTEVVPQAVIEDMRSVVRRLDPSVPVLQAKTMRRQLEDSLEGTLAGTAAIGVVGTLALGLASIGLYAVVAFAVSRRSLEIGIRIALGSGRWRVLWLTMREAMAVVGIGLLVGLGLSVVLSQTLSGLLYGVAPVDPIALGLALTVLGLVTLVAAWLPARRATARHPLELLRHD